MGRITRVVAGAASVIAVMTSVLAPVSSPAAATAPTWSLLPSPNIGGILDVLYGVSCPTTTFCVAVGSEVIEMWNGVSWSIATGATPATAGFQAVDCISTRACEAVGGIQNGAIADPFSEAWDGTRWATQPTPSPTGSVQAALVGVSCVSASSCTAVGESSNGSADATLVERWNGASWSIVPSPNPSSTGAIVLEGVSCTSSTFCAAVGYSAGAASENTLTEIWNGATWAVMPSPTPVAGPDVMLRGVSCTSATFCMAVGVDINAPYQSPADLVETWNGSAWANASSNSLYDDPLVGVMCASAQQCTVVGDGVPQGSSVVLSIAATFDGAAWTVASTPSPGTAWNVLNGVACASTTSCMAVGYQSDKGSSGQKTLIEGRLARARTTTTLAATPATLGAVVTLSATVVPFSGTGTPTGSVRFTDVTTHQLLGTAPLVGGQATIPTAFAVTGSYTIAARYSGDTVFKPSGARLVVTVAAAGRRR